jgi:hypothetical protein
MLSKHTSATTICLASLFTLGRTLEILNLTTPQPNVPFAPSPLPPSHASSDGEKIIELFQNLSRDSVWKQVSTTSFEGNLYEPEGIVRLGSDRWIVSAGEWTEPTVTYPDGPRNGTDRSAGAGFAHMIVFDGEGKRIADVTVTEEGDSEYHTGGIDFDGKYIWSALAEYRPNSTGYLTRFDPKTLEHEVVLRHNDHLGAVVHDTRAGRLHALNWGSRKAAAWSSKKRYSTSGFTTPDATVRNPSHFIDYQDCKFLSSRSRLYLNRPVMLCSGVAILRSGLSIYGLGGLALVDVETMLPLAEVPILMRSQRQLPVTMNPMEVSVSEEGKLRVYWLPDLGLGSQLYTFEAQ